jgi:hypothetical protein
MNMLMIAPLCDSRGKVRYFIGAQVDVSGLVKDCAGLESLQRLVMQEREAQAKERSGSLQEARQDAKDEFQELSEMFNAGEIDTVRKHGGRLHREEQEGDGEQAQGSRPRLLLKEPSDDVIASYPMLNSPHSSGRLSGVYQNYLLLRPYPSLRILFASPSLRVPGLTQSPFMSKIGGSSRVQDELTAALAEGRGVTAKIRWITRHDEEGRPRWIHCTPLLGANGAIGVWMVVLVDDEEERANGGGRRWKQAPPVDVNIARSSDRSEGGTSGRRSNGDTKWNGTYGESGHGNGNVHDYVRPGTGMGSVRSSSPFSVTI